MYRKYTISATALKTYDECPNQARFRYILKEKSTDLNGRNFVVGSAMHNIVDAWAKGRSTLPTVPAHLRKFDPYTPGWTADVIVQYLDAAIASQKVFRYLDNLKQETLTKYGPAKNDREQLLNKLRRACFVAEELTRVLKFQENEILTEVKIDMPYDKHQDFKFYGFIDVVDPVRNAIFDWKASASDQWIIESQIVLYAWLYERMTGIKSKYGGWLLPLKVDGAQTRTIEITQHMLDSISDKVDAYVDAVITDNLPINPKSESTCNQCPFKSKCEKFGDQARLFKSIGVEL